MWVFGPGWNEDWYATATKVSTPFNYACIRCSRLIVATDQGLCEVDPFDEARASRERRHVVQPQHLECYLGAYPNGPPPIRFQPMDGHLDGHRRLLDGHLDGQMDGQVDGQVDGHVDGHHHDDDDLDSDDSRCR